MHATHVRRVAAALLHRATLVLTLAGALAACGREARSEETGKGGGRVRTLTLGGYTTPREVYGREIIPAFQKFWKEKTGEEVRFEESYLGSGAQARAIVGGFEADVAALSLEPDIQQIVDAGLIRHDWKAGPGGGMVSRSVVVIGVRPGNPKGLRDWADLARPGVQVLTPSPRTSGGAMWNIAALYGSGSRGSGGAAAGERLVGGVLKNVAIMDKGARESMITFENGVGDAAITYENEVLVARKEGKAMDYVVPRSTILIENPIAVVDAYADKHGVRDVAEAFVAFLQGEQAQRAFAAYGLRPVDAKVAAETDARLPKVADLFTIRDLGGWPGVTRTLFAEGALFDRALAAK